MLIHHSEVHTISAPLCIPTCTRKFWAVCAVGTVILLIFLPNSCALHSLTDHIHGKLLPHLPLMECQVEKPRVLLLSRNKGWGTHTLEAMAATETLIPYQSSWHTCWLLSWSLYRTWKYSECTTWPRLDFKPTFDPYHTGIEKEMSALIKHCIITRSCNVHLKSWAVNEESWVECVLSQFYWTLDFTDTFGLEFFSSVRFGWICSGDRLIRT